MKRQFLFAALLIISLVGYGQVFHNAEITDSTRVKTLYYNPNIHTISFDTTLPKPQKDTVDVICLVSDTSNWHDYSKWKEETFLPISQCQTVKSKAVRESYPYVTSDGIYLVAIYKTGWKITEYLLPKKYIVWQSMTIDDKR